MALGVLRGMVRIVNDDDEYHYLGGMEIFIVPKV